MADPSSEALSSSPAHARLRGVPATLALAVLGVLPTLGRFWNGLVFDDRFVIGEGTFIFDPQNLARLLFSRTMAASSLDEAVGTPALDTYRPVPVLSFFWDAWLSGRSPIAYHATNLVLHACVIAALHRLLVRQSPSGRGWAITFATLAFAWSPWLSEAHVWIDGRSDPFCALFVVLALSAQHRALTAPRHPARWAALAGLALLLALLSKEPAIMAAPLIACAPTYEPVALRARASRAVPLALAIVVYAALRLNALDGARVGDPGASSGAVVRNAAPLFADAFVHVVVPLPYHLRNLVEDYALLGALERVVIAIVVTLSLVLGTYALHRRRLGRARFGLLLFVATAAPALAITQASWPGFGRFLYLPAIGLAIGVSELLERIEARGGTARGLAFAACALHLVTSAFLLVLATRVFEDDETLFTDAIDAHPDQAWPYGFLGMALASGGRCEDALPALEVASIGEPAEPRYRVHFGRCLLETGRVDRARAVAVEGEARFEGTSAEAGFLLLHASTLGPAQAPLARALLERCLDVAPARTDCRRALEVVAASE